MSTLQAIAERMRKSDIDQGHAGTDTQWGRYEVLARVAVEEMHARGIIGPATLNAVLAGN